MNTYSPYPAVHPTDKKRAIPEDKLTIKRRAKPTVQSTAMTDVPTLNPFVNPPTIQPFANPPAAPKTYSPETDPTLSTSEADKGGYKPTAALNPDEEYRVSSTALPAGYTSGKHEMIPTDLIKALRVANDNKNGSHTMQYDNVNTTVNSAALDIVLQLADGFRTDTAQTILSASGGKAAGHTHSGMKTTGQPDAHDLLREKIMDILGQDPKDKTKGMSKASVAVFFGAMTVISMAPVDLAKMVDGSLRAGNMAESAWEENRNEAKARVHSGFTRLGSDEQKFVMQHAQEFLNSTMDSQNPARELSLVEPTSPFRTSKGEYDKTIRRIPKSALPDLKYFGLYATQSFRGIKRE